MQTPPTPIQNSSLYTLLCTPWPFAHLFHSHPSLYETIPESVHTPQNFLCPLSHKPDTPCMCITHTSCTSPTLHAFCPHSPAFPCSSLSSLHSQHTSYMPIQLEIYSHPPSVHPALPTLTPILHKSCTLLPHSSVHPIPTHLTHPTSLVLLL